MFKELFNQTNLNEGLDPDRVIEQLINAFYDDSNSTLELWYANKMNSSDYRPDKLFDEYLDDLSDRELFSLFKKAKLRYIKEGTEASDIAQGSSKKDEESIFSKLQKKDPKKKERLAKVKDEKEKELLKKAENGKEEETGKEKQEKQEKETKKNPYFGKGK